MGGKFFIRRYIRDSQGIYVPDGSERSLEDDFGFLRYKSLSGINSRGQQSGVYVEDYSDGTSSRVFVSSKPVNSPISSTLEVYSFGYDPSLSFPEDATLSSVILSAESNWHRFFDFLEGALLLWRDDYRQRLALFYVKDAVEPSKDVIDGIPYLQCSVKFENVFGKTFPLGDKTISSWLLHGGKEVL